MKRVDERVDEQRAESGDRGSALIIVTIILAMLMTLAASVTTISTSRSKGSLETKWRVLAEAEAESGIGIKLDQIEASGGDLQGPITITTPNGTIDVVCWDLGSDGVGSDLAEDKTVRIVSTFTSNTNIGGSPIVYRVVAYVRSTYHPAFYKGIYVGNKQGFPTSLVLGPSDGDNTTYTWDESQWADENYRLSEAEMGIDFNGDGDYTDEPKMSDIYAMPAWTPYMEQSGTDYRLDINKDSPPDYADSYTNTLPYSYAAPSGSETPDPAWEGKVKDNGDYVEGDVYVNGGASLQNDTLMWGDLDATETVAGNVVTGSVTEEAPPIQPPDLHAYDYENIADEVIDPTIAATLDSKRFFAENTSISDFYAELSVTGQDNNITHLGPNSNGAAIAFDNNDDGKLVFIKSNLWLHTSSDKKLNMPGGKNVVITLVIEGNLYIGDDLDYNNNQTGILFLVKGKTDDPATPEREDETFLDTNKNYVYDAGEPIINDDGNGVYDGPVEGQGNIYFMDPKYGTGGVTDGFMYAENNAYINPPYGNPTGKDRIYGVKGFLSAGGVFDLGARNSGNGYINYKVQYDPRIENGTLTFTGMPKAAGGGYAGLEVLVWHKLNPDVDINATDPGYASGINPYEVPPNGVNN